MMQRSVLPHEAGVFSKIPVRTAIEQQIEMASHLIAVDAKRIISESAVASLRFDADRIPRAMSHRIQLLVKLRMGRHVEHDHVPPEMVSSVEYRLSFLIHSSGPIFTRAERVVDSQNPDLHEVGILSDGWELIAEDGDLEKVEGGYWPDLNYQITRDFGCIVPEGFAADFLDGDLTAEVAFDDAYWVSAECKPVVRH